MSQRLSWLSTFLATILIIECSWLTYSTYHRLKRETQPHRLVGRAEKLLVDNYPQLRAAWLDTTRQQTPQLAQQASDALLSQLPQWRRQLEAMTVEHMERGIDNAVELSADEFRQWLRNNHDAIEEIFIQVEQAPNDARWLVLDTELTVEEQLGVDLRDQAKLTLEFYRIFNDKLEELANPSGPLTRRQLLERRTIRIVRALTQGVPVTRDAALRDY